MFAREINWMIGGPQGSGVDTAANIFGRACSFGGYNLYGKREYHSNIKGLHSYFHLRVSEKRIEANVNDVDLLAAFDAETVVRHFTEVVPKGGLILDEEDLKTRISNIQTLPPEFTTDLQEHLEKERIGDSIGDLVQHLKENDVHIYVVPFLDLLKEVARMLGIEKLSKVTRMKNVLAIGISFALLNYDDLLVKKAIESVFSKKPEIAKMNILAYEKARQYAEMAFGNSFPLKLKGTEVQEEKLFLAGDQAVALGKVYGGCRLQTYYPITPAADESEFLESHELLELKNGDGAIIVVQTEDEIAAVNMASGAALTGTRASTSTSGPGFSLMVEGLSWAGNNEVPIVVTYYQRGAPSTGLPTRHGQDDLRFAIHAVHGDFPRIVLASGDVTECFFDAAQAFNYAERFQLPVIHLVDKALANSTQSCPLFNLNQVTIERGRMATASDHGSNQYKRFKFTDTGISPRAFLGMEDTVMWYTGDEHNELGHVSEEPHNRKMMMEKRMNKLEVAGKEIPLEEKLSYFGKQDSEIVVVSWGSPKGAILEAIKTLENEGYELAFLQVRIPHPLPKERIAEILRKSRIKVGIEMNYSGQLGSLITEKTGIMLDYYILKYNGRPMTTTEVYEGLKRILKGEAEKRQVLTYGS
ncbi:MAG: 2-oxoacid:ferredoxin oxidoreductase subunit alpha [Candidatus Bathyarchaeota archaeon]|nr:2-oxoacid:ferredoxin oxidoreductase subunit alpha [Candidatus Bathyarchaeota archaeon]